MKNRYRSPDLSSLDFFLWGYLKEKVYVNNPQNVQELKENIRNEIGTLNQNPEILQSVVNNFFERMRMCEAENGRHLKDVIFHV